MIADRLKQIADYEQNEEILKEDFLMACDLILGQKKQTQGFGTLQEKTVHEVVKHFYDASRDYHEIPLGKKYIADLYQDDSIVEVQNGNFNKMRDKLAFYFEEGYDVTICYPIPFTKKIYWLDEETGELSKGSKSPKKGSPYDAFRELYKLRQFLGQEHLHFHLMFLELEEFRLLNGWSRDRKRGSRRYDRIPSSLHSFFTIDKREDYAKFLPESLPDEFTSADLAKCAHAKIEAARTCLLILRDLEIVECIGKQGQKNLYRRLV